MCKFEGPRYFAWKARKLVNEIIKDNDYETDDSNGYETILNQMMKVMINLWRHNLINQKKWLA